MKMQQFDPKIISISQIRRDINALEKVLAEEDEAVVMRNQDIIFVAVKPEKYQRLKPDVSEDTQVAISVAAINRLRETVGKKKKKMSTAEFIIKMRDERVAKWKK